MPRPQRSPSGCEGCEAAEANLSSKCEHCSERRRYGSGTNLSSSGTQISELSAPRSLSSVTVRFGMADSGFNREPSSTTPSFGLRRYGAIENGIASCRAPCRRRVGWCSGFGIPRSVDMLTPLLRGSEKPSTVIPRPAKLRRTARQALVRWEFWRHVTASLRHAYAAAAELRPCTRIWRTRGRFLNGSGRQQCREGTRGPER